MKDKKFHCRPQHLKGIFYTVQYSYHRFLPNWRTISFWDDPGSNFSHEGWSPKIFQSLKEAEEFAAKFKSINDVESYYKNFEKKANDFYLKKTK